MQHTVLKGTLHLFPNESGLLRAGKAVKCAKLVLDESQQPSMAHHVNNCHSSLPAKRTTPRSDTARRSLSGTIRHRLLVYHPRIGEILPDFVSFENVLHGVSDEAAHLGPSDAVHFNGIDARWDRYGMRMRKKFPIVNQLIDPVQGQDQMGETVALHRGNGVRTGIRRPSRAAVMEIEKAQWRHVNDVLGNLLPEGGHQAEVWLPIVDKRLMEFGGFDPSGKEGQILRMGKPPDKRFILWFVWIFPEATFGIAPRLGWVIRGNTHDSHAASQITQEQLAQDMVASHETSKNGDARPTLWNVA